MTAQWPDCFQVNSSNWWVCDRRHLIKWVLLMQTCMRVHTYTHTHTHTRWTKVVLLFLWYTCIRKSDHHSWVEKCAGFPFGSQLKRKFLKCQYIDNSVLSLFLLHILLGLADILKWIKIPQPINPCTFSGTVFCLVYTGPTKLQPQPSDSAQKEVERISISVYVSSNSKEIWAIQVRG